MKFGRSLFAITLAVVVLLLLVVGAALSSSVQTWAVHRALDPELGTALTFDRVSAGWDHATVTHIRWQRSGAVLTMPSAEIDLPILSSLWGKKLLIQKLTAQGWTLDLSSAQLPAPPATAARNKGARAGFSLVTTAYADDIAAPAPTPIFSGIFEHLNLPIDLAIEDLDLEGSVVLPRVPRHPATPVRLSVTGGNLAAGKPGKFDYTAVVTFQGADAPVHELTIHGTLGVVMDTPRSFTRLVVTTDAEATGPKFPGGVKLALELLAARSASGENYAASVSSGSKQLAALETSYPARASRLSGSWRLDMRDSDLAPFSFGRDLPTFEAVGEGSFDTDTAFIELRASGRLNAAVDRLDVISDQFSALGAIHLTSEFDFAQRAGATRVDRLAVTVEGARPIATVQALQAFEFNLKTGELNVADPGKELLGVVFQGLPLAWLDPLLAREGFSLRGDDLKGGFAASARNGGFTLRPKAPLTVEHLQLSRVGGARLLVGVDVSLSASGDYTPLGWQVELAPFTLRTRDGPLLTIEGKVGQLAGARQPVKTAGTWKTQLPALLAQPGIPGGLALTAGSAQGSFAASLGEKREVELRLALNGLATAAAAALPEITAELRADREADGKITFSAPIGLEREGRKSDLTLSGTLVPKAGNEVVDGRISSDAMAIEDATLLALALQAAPIAASRGSTPAVPIQPCWSGVTGQIALSFKKLVYQKEFQVTDVAGSLRIDADGLKLSNGFGVFDADSDVKFGGAITFVSTAAQPYTLAGDFALNNFATAPAFRAINPTKPPTIEARIMLTSKLAATGSSLPELFSRARGDMVITSKGGIFRALSADLTDRIQKTQSRVVAIASFLGVVPDDYVNKTKILSDIAKALAEIPFDQLSVTATRDSSLNLELKDFTLISPEVRIGGTGEIRHVEGVPVLAQPLQLQLNLAARGKLGDLIKRAGLLDKQQDNLGYAAFSVPLGIGGTLDNPDTNDIRNALLNSALERSGLLDSLMGK